MTKCLAAAAAVADVVAVVDAGTTTRYVERRLECSHEERSHTRTETISRYCTADVDILASSTVSPSLLLRLRLLFFVSFSFSLLVSSSPFCASRTRPHPRRFVLLSSAPTSQSTCESTFLPSRLPSTRSTVFYVAIEISVPILTSESTR